MKTTKRILLLCTFLSMLAIMFSTDAKGQIINRNMRIQTKARNLNIPQPDSIGRKSFYYFGWRIGFPILFGLRSEIFLQRANDGMPIYFVATDIGLSWGYGGSVAIARRFNNSSYYLELGFHYWRLIFALAAGEVVVGIDKPINSLLLGFMWRSYHNFTFKSLSIGTLITPSSSFNFPWVLPVFYLSMTR